MYRLLWILSEPASKTREIDDLSWLRFTAMNSLRISRFTAMNWAEGPQSHQLKFSHYINVGSWQYPLWVSTGWRVQTDGSVFRGGQLSFWGAQDMRYTNVLFWPTITTSLWNPLNVNSLFSQKTKMSFLYVLSSQSQFLFPTTLPMMIWVFRAHSGQPDLTKSFIWEAGM